MINLFDDGDRWFVWTDTEVSERDGRCIGCGNSKREALSEARTELAGELSAVEKLLKEEAA